MMNTFSRDKHGLHPTHLDALDQMNFLPVQNITDPGVINLLENHVNEIAGTFLYAKLLVVDNVLRSFLDMSLLPLHRFEKMLFSIFIRQRYFVLPKLRDAKCKMCCYKVVICNCRHFFCLPWHLNHRCTIRSLVSCQGHILRTWLELLQKISHR